ncbi:M20 peptidase family dipeptidase, partial [Burkholderia sp. Ac-20392]|nr:M20 peptidase family dipeptidase [Burkholderia sp. Ac-20392]
MSRTAAIQHALNQFESGAFFTTLSRRVGLRTESQDSGNEAALRAYLTDEIAPEAARLGFTSRIVDNPVDGGGPFLLASRHEDDALPTVLIYGHGDVVRGYDAQWRAPLSPWTLT